MPDEIPDRYHNREEDSPESLRRSIDALADAVSALDRKLDNVAVGLGTDIDGARGVTRHLANDVAMMGEALVRRIESAAPARPVAVRTPPRRPRVALWVLGVMLLIAVAAAAIWFAPRQIERPRTVTTPVVTISPPSPSPPVAAPPETPADVAPPIHHTPRVGAGHRRRTHYPWRPRAIEPPSIRPFEPS